LTALQSNLFTSQTQLRLLFLQQNDIGYVAPGVLNTLTHLQRLNMTLNYLTQLLDNTIPSSPTTYQLLFADNQITLISVALVSTWANTANLEIQMEGNPLRCTFESGADFTVRGNGTYSCSCISGYTLVTTAVNISCLPKHCKNYANIFPGPVAMTYKNAQAYCVAQGGNLPTPEDALAVAAYDYANVINSHAATWTTNFVSLPTNGNKKCPVLEPFATIGNTCGSFTPVTSGKHCGANLNFVCIS